MAHDSLFRLWWLLLVCLPFLGHTDEIEMSGHWKRSSRIIPNLVSLSNCLSWSGSLNLLGIGTFLTFAQFLYVTIQNVSSQVVFPPTSAKSRWSRWIRVPSLRKRQVPLKRWLVQVLLFLAVSLSEFRILDIDHDGMMVGDWRLMDLVNNYAFALKIPVTLHIIFRSGGELDICTLSY